MGTRTVNFDEGSTNDHYTTSPGGHMYSSSPSSAYDHDAVEAKTVSAPLSWFDQHPVIATVLWALGSDVKSFAPGGKNHNTLRTWNESATLAEKIRGVISETALSLQAASLTTHGPAVTKSGHINPSHLLYSVSSSPSSSVPMSDRSDNVSNTDDGTLLSRGTQGYHGRCYGDSHHKSSSSSSSGYLTPEQTLSPYGFFVAITPPQDQRSYMYQQQAISSSRSSSSFASRRNI